MTTVDKSTTTFTCNRCGSEAEVAYGGRPERWIPITWGGDWVSSAQNPMLRRGFEDGKVLAHAARADLCSNCYIDFATFMKRCKL